jgi:hypothetical protein
MKRRNSDPRYYLCPHEPCTGEVDRVGMDTQQQAVYECKTCRRRAGESQLLRAQVKRKAMD